MHDELDERAYDHAKQASEEARIVVDERDDSNRHEASAEAMGIDDPEAEGTKARCDFPYGDCPCIDRGILAAESHAGRHTRVRDLNELERRHRCPSTRKPSSRSN